jgi:hypothetical protein
MTENIRQLELPEDMCRAVEQRFGSNYGGLEEFLIFVLRELTRDANQKDKTDRRVIEDRLRDLGYIE